MWDGVEISVIVNGSSELSKDGQPTYHMLAK